MPRFTWTFLIAGFALVVTACGQQGGFKAESVGPRVSATKKSLSYELYSCDFFPTFETQAKMCEALQDDAFNHNCEPETREQKFKEECPGDFRPGTLEDLKPVGFGGSAEAPDATPKPQAPDTAAPAPAPAPTPDSPPAPVNPEPAPAPSIPGDSSVPSSPEITVPKPPPGATGPATPAPAPQVRPEPDLAAVVTTSNLKDGDLTRMIIQRVDLEPAKIDIGCSKSLTVALDRVESVVMVPGAQTFVALKKNEKSKFVGKVATCKGTIDADAVKTPESNQRIERKDLAHGQKISVRIMEGNKLEFICMKDKATALTAAKTGLVLIAGTIVMVKTGDGESVPMRIYQCAN